MAVIQVQKGDVLVVPAEYGEITLRVVPIEPEDPPLWVDVRERMPRNTAPDGDPILAARGGWWKRPLNAIDGITIHHTLTNNMEAAAASITRPKDNGGKGYPTTQYHFWVAPDGSIFYCVDLTEGLWHDHCGDHNTHISVGMAGHLDIAPPPQVQLQATARLVAHLCREFSVNRDKVDGHKEWAWRAARVGTVCPGWVKANWRDDFFRELDLALSEE